MTKELSDFKKEDILNPDLIGGGLPDLETEIAKLQSGESGFGATGFEQEPEEQEPEASCEGKDCQEEEQKEEEYF